MAGNATTGGEETTATAVANVSTGTLEFSMAGPAGALAPRNG